MWAGGEWIEALKLSLKNGINIAKNIIMKAITLVFSLEKIVENTTWFASGYDCETHFQQSEIQARFVL